MSKRGDAIVLWDSLASLPLVASLVDDSDGVALAPTKDGITIQSRAGIIEIWRDDALDLALTHAAQTLTLTGLPADTQTVTIGAKTYTWQATLTNVDGNVKIGADAPACVVNLVAAIMLGAGAGTKYATAMTAHPSVTAVDGAGDTVVVTAIVGGTAGNAIVTTETMDNATWGAATLAGGAAEADIAATLDFPLYLYGWNGSAWLLDDTIAAADVAVGRQRGVEYEAPNGGLYERLALIATGATVPDSGTVRATYTPIPD